MSHQQPFIPRQTKCHSFLSLTSGSCGADCTRTTVGSWSLWTQQSFGTRDGRQAKQTQLLSTKMGDRSFFHGLGIKMEHSILSLQCTMGKRNTTSLCSAKRKIDRRHFGVQVPCARDRPRFEAPRQTTRNSVARLPGTAGIDFLIELTGRRI